MGSRYWDCFTVGDRAQRAQAAKRRSAHDRGNTSWWGQTVCEDIYGMTVQYIDESDRQCQADGANG